MTDSVAQEFSDELRSFFLLSLLNIVFGAIIMAFGLQVIVTSALSVIQGGTSPALSGIQGLIGAVGAVVGFRWILSSVRIFRGIREIRDEAREISPVIGDVLTGLIVRMLGHYRDNRATIQTMNFICTLGGAIFLALGILNIVQGVPGLTSQGETALPWFPFLAAAINLSIGLVSLLFSGWFRKYSRAWDLRLEEASRSEAALRQALEQGSS